MRVDKIMKLLGGICLMVVMIAFLSCNKSVQRAEAWRDYYKDSVFIDVPGNSINEMLVNGVTVPLGKGNVCLMKTRYLSGDTLCLGVTCGADVRVSENVYEYMLWVTHDENLKLKTDSEYELRLIKPENYYMVLRKDFPVRENCQRVNGAVSGIGKVALSYLFYYIVSIAFSIRCMVSSLPIISMTSNI